MSLVFQRVSRAQLNNGSELSETKYSLSFLVRPERLELPTY